MINNQNNENIINNFQGSLLKYGFYGVNFSLIGFYPFTINNKTYSPVSLILTDPEFKAGGSLFRKIDICAVGQGVYAKNLNNNKVGEANQGDLLSYYAGVELRTRFTRCDFINFFIRYGYRYDYMNCTINDVSSLVKPVLDQDRGYNMFSFGITMISFGNNELLRLWYKPIINRY